MTIAELLEKYSLTQQELADFTGIPRARIQKWIQNDKEPPKAHDVNILEVAKNFLEQHSPYTAKSIVKTHRIFMGNVELIENIEHPKVENEGVTYSKRKKNPRLDMPSSDNILLNRCLDLITQLMNENEGRWDRLLDAHQKLIDKLPDQHK